FHEGCAAGRDASLVEGDLLCLGLADIAAALVLAGGVALGVVIIAADVAGVSVDLIVILPVPGVKFHIVDQAAVVIVPLHSEEGGVALGDAGVVQGNGLGFGLADITSALALAGDGVALHIPVIAADVAGQRVDVIVILCVAAPE